MKLKKVYNNGGFISDVPVFVKNALTFDFDLPFNARIGKTYFTTTDQRSNEIFGFQFAPAEIKQEGELMPIPICFLRVKGALFDLPLSYEDFKIENRERVNNFLSDLFDRIIQHLNNFITSYIVITKDTFPNFVSLHSSSMALWCFMEISESLKKDDLMPYVTSNFEKAQNKGILTLDWPRATKGMTELPALPRETYEKVLHHMNLSPEMKNPFYNSELFFILSRKYLEEANCAASIIFMQSSFETFLYSLLRILGLDSDLSKTYESVERYIASKHFVSIFKRAFLNHFKNINRDYSSEQSPFFYFFKEVYSLRNRVIHRGYNPNYILAHKAFDILAETRSFLTTAINSQHKDIYDKFLK